MKKDEEFYVGYAPAPPPRLKRTAFRTVVFLNLAGVALAVVLVLGQERFAPAAFEFQRFREFEGLLREHPYPALLVRRPGAADGALPFSRYLLVAPGKHGASAMVAGLNDRRVRVRGSLIYRGPDTMIEVEAPPVAVAGHDAPAAVTTELGEVSLAGEIVDSKCYLGVMNPGSGKVHRDCAIRCISGGIPPLFAVKDAEGQPRALVLAGGDGRQLNREVLGFVAEPITIRGRLTQSGETFILWAEPAGFKRRQ